MTLALHIRRTTHPPIEAHTLCQIPFLAPRMEISIDFPACDELTLWAMLVMPNGGRHRKIAVLVHVVGILTEQVRIQSIMIPGASESGGAVDNQEMSFCSLKNLVFGRSERIQEVIETRLLGIV